MECKLCGNTTNNTAYHVKEMLLGTKDQFEYFQCGSCECLQIATIPANMSRYYPETYYSFSEIEQSPIMGLRQKLRGKFVKLRDMYAITNKGMLGRFLYSMKPFVELRGLALCNITKETSILDIGCGAGHYLYKLRGYGFKNLLGVDPYLEKTIEYKNDLTIKKADLSEMDGKWDVIMLHHSLEHMEKQTETLQKIASLLNDDGLCLIRIPTVSSEPWDTYRGNWVHLDPPRHFFLHSHKSLKLVAEQSGLSVISITSDANPFSFYGSEFYKRGIPATEWREDTFNPSERKEFARRAKEINSKGRGDTIAVILRKKTNHEHA